MPSVGTAVFFMLNEMITGKRFYSYRELFDLIDHEEERTYINQNVGERGYP